MKQITFILFWVVTSAYSQTAIDSLRKVAKTQSNEALVATYVNLSWEYRNSAQDSAIYYARETLQLSKKLNYKKGIASGYNSLGSSYQASGKLDSARVYLKKSLEIQTVIKDSTGMADSYNNLGIIADETSNYETALDYYFKALRIYEKNPKDIANVPMVYSNIGIVYKKQKEYQKTLNYYKKALAIYVNSKNAVGETITRGNIGSLLLQLKKYEQAISYATAAKNDYERLGYVRYVPYMLVNNAVARDSLKQHIAAQQDYELAIKLFEKDTNLYELTNALIGYGQNQLNRNEADAAKASLNRALVLAQNNKFKEFEVRAYRYLAKAYAQRNDFKTAFKYQEQYRIGYDSLFEAGKTKSILELDVKYQSEKKEKELAIKEAALLKNEIKLKQRNNILLLLALGLASAVLIGYLIYRQQRLKNMQLLQENELNEAKSKLVTEQRLQEQRLRISRDLHDNIGSQLTFVISSLDNLKYAKHVPLEVANDKLASLSTFTRTTITELRDTIWAMNKDRITIAALKERLTGQLNQAANAGLTTEITLNLDNNVDHTLSFNALKGMHVYRIIQEAINNALKYAQATSINVSLKIEKEVFVVTILDNGIGFSKENAVMGNGLRNMQQRVDEIKGTLVISSELEQGTDVTFTFPVK